MCYELMEHFYASFRSSGISEKDAYTQMFDAVRFVFLHEIAHAIIDKYKLPIIGNEEDAADRCSAYINLEELGSDGVKAILAAADAFAIESKRTADAKKNMADEHLLGEQRYYNALCMVYGSNASKWEKLVNDGYLPKERAVRCPTEYGKTVDAWSALLGPWRKN
jgi:Zn-dependent peptidase ImmA (M78 family)